MLPFFYLTSYAKDSSKALACQSMGVIDRITEHIVLVSMDKLSPVVLHKLAMLQPANYWEQHSVYPMDYIQQSLPILVEAPSILIRSISRPKWASLGKPASVMLVNIYISFMLRRSVAVQKTFDDNDSTISYLPSTSAWQTNSNSAFFDGTLQYAFLIRKTIILPKLIQLL